MNGASDFAGWHEGVRTLIRHLGGFGHIASLLDPVTPHRPDLNPSAPPVLTGASTPFEVDAHSKWWEVDNVVQHVLVARLGSSPRMLLPEEGADRTAQDIYDVLKSNFGSNRRSEGTNLFLELLGVRCQPHRVRDYVMTWQNAVTKMRSCRFLVPGYVLALLFVKHLPDSLAFGSLRLGLGQRLEHVAETDIEVFKEVLNNALELEAQFRSIASSSQSRLLTGQHSSRGQVPSQGDRAPRPIPGAQHPQAPAPSASSDSSASARLPGSASSGLVSDRSSGGGQGSRQPDSRHARAFVADVQDLPLANNESDDLVVFGNDVAPTDTPGCIDILPTHVAAVSLQYDPERLVSDADTFDIGGSVGSQAGGFMAMSPELEFALSSSAMLAASRVNMLLDSGCSHHLIKNRSLFSTYDVSGATSVTTANCGSLNTLASGDVTIRIPFRDRFVNMTLRNCLHAPDVPIHLLSVGVLQHAQVAIRFEPASGLDPPYTEVVFPQTHPVLPGFKLRAILIRQLSFLACDFVSPAFPLSASPGALACPALDPQLAPTFPRADLSPALWHRHLSHLGMDAVRALLTKAMVTGAECSGSFDRVHCVACLIGKAPQQPYAHNGNRALGIGDLLHMDICGPYPVATLSGMKYFYVILDDCANFGFTTLLRLRSGAFNFYTSTEAYLERTTGRPVRTVRLDGALEFTAGVMGKHFASKGISVQVTAPYAHSQNGKAERYVRTLEDGGQTLIADSGLPASFWGDAVLTVQYIRNRVPTSALPDGKTPYEVFFGSKPDISHLRVWGCQCFAAIPKELRTKGGPRRFEGIFVGYEEGRVGWRVRDLQGRTHFSRDVIFNESSAGRRARLPRSMPPPADVAARPSRQRILDIAGDVFAEALDLSHSVRSSRTLQAGGVDAGGAPILRRSRRVAERLPLAATSFEAISADLISLTTVFPGALDTGLASLLSLESDALLALPALPTDSPPASRWDLRKPPVSYAEACARPDAPAWCAAMDREIASLREMDAFAKCALPQGRRPLDLKWVYDYKTDSEGNIIVGREKARLVAMGFRQRPEDFGETAAPVARLTSVRVILAWAAIQDLEIYQFDCKTAFLHARLRHDVFCRPFSGWPMSRPGNVLKIQAALYGLKQSAYEFYILLSSLLLALGLSRCECDHGVFFGVWTAPPDPDVLMPSDGSPLVLFVPVHVDDGLGITNSQSLYLWFLKSLSHRLHIVDLGICSKFLNIVIVRNRPARQLWLSSQVYVTELLTDWNMLSCRPASTPLASAPLPATLGNSLPDVSDADLKTKYQRLVGCLIYLAVSTHPDIAFASMWLGQFSAAPTRSHFLAAKHVLRYLAGTRTLALSYGVPHSSTPSTLKGFMHNMGCSDADWASDASNRRSISGFCFFFQGSLVSWSAVKQRTIALSSTEAEYYALTHAFKEALWLRVFLSLLNLPVPRPFSLFSDNQAAISLSSSSSISSRSKHIDIRYHFLRSHVSDGSFLITWIPSTDMPADLFTKSLPDPTFSCHRSVLGLLPLISPP